MGAACHAAKTGTSTTKAATLDWPVDRCGPEVWVPTRVGLAHIDDLNDTMPSKGIEPKPWPVSE